jgi:aspartate carbamoyltransferase catalytic subunit
LQRVQFERHPKTHILRRRAFARRYGLTAPRAARMPAHVVILHPGPINRGIEIDGTVADGPRSLILTQVANGIAVRAAVLRWALSDRGTAPVNGPTETLR